MVGAITMDMARKKQMITLTLDPELVERLKAWIARQEFPPAQNAVIAKAIERFLDENEPVDKAPRKSKQDAGAG
jgi:hypothetical protein